MRGVRGGGCGLIRIFAFLESLLLKGREYKQCFHVKVTNFVQRCFYDGYDCFMLSAFFCFSLQSCPRSCGTWF